MWCHASRVVFANTQSCRKQKLRRIGRTWWASTICCWLWTSTKEKLLFTYKGGESSTQEQCIVAGWSDLVSFSHSAWSVQHELSVCPSTLESCPVMLFQVLRTFGSSNLILRNRRQSLILNSPTLRGQEQNHYHRIKQEGYFTLTLINHTSKL